MMAAMTANPKPVDRDDFDAAIRIITSVMSDGYKSDLSNAIIDDAVASADPCAVAGNLAGIAVAALQVVAEASGVDPASVLQQLAVGLQED